MTNMRMLSIKLMDASYHAAAAKSTAMLKNGRMVFPVFKDFTGKMVLYLEISVKKATEAKFNNCNFFPDLQL